MPNKWFRDSALYEDIKHLYNPCLLKEICLFNFAEMVIVKEIRIQIKKTFVVSFIIEACTFFTDEMQAIFKNFFLPTEYSLPSYYGNFYGRTFEIPFESKKTFEKMLQLLVYVNANYKENEFSSEIINELKKIVLNLPSFINDLKNTKDLASYSNKKYVHSIPMMPIFKTHTNPSLRNSQALVDYTSWSKTHENFDFIEFVNLLKNGENPNQREVDTGLMPLNNAVWTRSIEVLKLLLCYGAILFDRNNIFHDNPIEQVAQVYRDCPDFTKRIEAKEKLNLMLNYTTYKNINKSLVNSFNLQLRQLSIAEHEKIIRTAFYFSNKNLIMTQLKSVDKITARERIELHNLFKKRFTSKSETDVIEIFENDLSNSDNLIEIIRQDSIMVGFNVYELMIIDNYIILHWIFTLREQALAITNFTLILAQRLAAGLQWLYNDRVVWMYFSSIHYNSMRMIENNLFSPKYQTDKIIALKKAIVNEIYDKTVFLHLHGVTCYGKEREQLQVIDSNQTKSPANIMYDFYHRYLCGHVEHTQDAEQRFVPILTPVGDDMINTLYQNCLNLNIKIFPYLQLFKIYLHSLIKDIMLIKSNDDFSGFVSSEHLFFCQRRMIAFSIQSHLDTIKNNLSRL